MCHVPVTVSVCWTASGAQSTVTARLTWTSHTVPCRKSVSGELLVQRVRMQTAWGSWVSELIQLGCGGQELLCLDLLGIVLWNDVWLRVTFSTPCPLSRWGGSIFKHDQERARGSGGRRHHGMHHGVGSGCLRLQAPNPPTISPAHVAAGSTGWVWPPPCLWRHRGDVF